MNVWLSYYSFAPSEPLILRIGDHGVFGELSGVGVRIFEIGEADLASMIATSASVVVHEQELEATLSLPDFFKPGSFYEIRSIVLGDEPDDSTTLVGGRDFPRVLFRVKASADDPRDTADEVAAAVSRIEAERERLYASPIGDSTKMGNIGFRVLMFVERIMLTKALRVPGVQMMPLRSGNQPLGNASTREVNVINGVLENLGWGVRLDASRWLRTTSNRRPITVLHIPQLFAANEDEALDLARYKRERLLDLFALHRRSYGVPFATVIQPLVGSQEERYANTGFYPEVEPFGGNLLGGTVSGESPKLWLDHDHAMDTNPFVALCLSLFREARGEIDLDFAYFRYWNLLEVIASDRVEGGVAVTDFEGQQLREGNRNANTNRPQGRVYELLKRYMLSRNYIEHNFGQPLPEGLWDAVRVWYACRNAAAHYGKFSPEDPAQQSRPWYPLALKAYEATMSQGGVAGLDPYFTNLEQASEKMVRRVLAEPEIAQSP